MAARKITPEFHRQLLEAFREAPAAFTRAARHAACGPRCAKTGWLRGWPKKGLRPIRELLKEEAEEARAMAQRQAEAERAKVAEDRNHAKADAIAALAEESRMLKIVRTNVIGQQAIANSMLGPMKAIADDLREQISKNPGLLRPKEVLGALRLFAHVHRMGAEAADKLIQAERRSRGEPVDILGVQAIPELTVEEAKHKVNLAAKAINRMMERGKVTVH